jgi:hypothetical protein
MVANVLSDTRVGLLAGSVLVDSAEPSPATSVTLTYKGWNAHFRHKGIYRIDAEPPRLWVQQGAAEVSSGDAGAPVSVQEGMYLPFAPVLVPERSIDVPGDALTDWAKGRSESISADNAITAQIDEDPASRDPGLGTDSFAYFPLIGVPSLGSGLYGGYSSFYPHQPGFNSIYLPGYTYRPFLFGLTPELSEKCRRAAEARMSNREGRSRFARSPAAASNSCPGAPHPTWSGARRNSSLVTAESYWEGA